MAGAATIRLPTNVSAYYSLDCFAVLPLPDSCSECDRAGKGRIKSRSDSDIDLRGIKEPCLFRRENSVSASHGGIRF